jgi:hypothetical protein
MQLTPQQIIALGSDTLAEVKSLVAVIDANMAKLNAHNQAKGAPAVNAGPFSVALGCMHTVQEQLAKHVAENTPKPAPAPDAAAPVAEGATQS